MQEVIGSIPFTSTIFFGDFFREVFFGKLFSETMVALFKSVDFEVPFV